MKLPLGFDMTTTRADFRRLLPAAVAHVRYVEQGDAFVHRDGERSWRIDLSPLPKLEIGLIRLERHRAEFHFSGYTQKEIDDFMARFERYFRRGGG